MSKWIVLEDGERIPWSPMAEWTVASCQAQGVPVKVTEPSVVEQVATLLAGAG